MHIRLDEPSVRPAAVRRPARGPVFVVGFHRSGTSLFAQWLDASGVAMGTTLTDNGMTPTGERGGHHEDIEIQGLHRRFLHSRGLDNMVSGAGGLPIELTDEERDSLSGHAERRAAQPCWGWKSPIGALFIEPWLEALPGALVLLQVRPPEMVADSLVRRGRDAHILHDPTLAVTAWTNHHRDLLRAMAPRPEQLLVITTSDWLDDSGPTSHALGEQLGERFEPVPVNSVRDGRFFRGAATEEVAAARRRRPVPFEEADDLFERLMSRSADRGA